MMGSFKRNCSGAVAGLAMLTALGMGQAQAADFEAPVASNYDWQGFYLGLAAAGVGSGIDVRGIGSKDKADLKDKNFGMAAIAGYNFTSGPWVWGVEGQVGRAALKKKGVITGLGTVSVESNYLTSLALRGGYAWDNFLLYGKVGAALTDSKFSSSLGGSSKKMLFGSVIGVGGEYAINDSWSVRAEALAYSFHDEPVLAGTKQKIDLGKGVVQVGVTMKF
jgi:outer membrane immunogenic protein